MLGIQDPQLAAEIASAVDFEVTGPDAEAAARSFHRQAGAFRFFGIPAVSVGGLPVVGVDWARLIFADLDALSSWQHADSIDGLADVAFWGRDADEAARALDAPMLGTAGEDGVRGWRELAQTSDASLAGDGRRTRF